MPKEKPDDTCITFRVNDDELAVLDKACEIIDRKRAPYVKRVILRDAARIINEDPPEID